MTPPFASIATSAAPWWVACAFAGAIVYGAWRVGSLKADGAIVALVIGVIALRVQWAWGVYLVAWFACAALLSRLGRARKLTRTQAIVAKNDRRDASQVLANGGVFALCALLILAMDRLNGSSEMAAALTIAAAGALAASGADTWSTEIGTWLGGDPVSVRTGKRVPVGTSGAVTMNGSLGAIVGAFMLSALAYGVSMIDASAVWSVASAGVTGAAVDTLLGAWVQERRWCPVCQQFTERRSHCNGALTEHRTGIPRLDNDAVNVMCSLTGA
ncbi:MAG: DUF92 domain-containing protein, partial [Gemmatimonas sp.]